MTATETVRPPGFWTREPLVTGPIVPLWASVWCEPVTRGFADAFARWGYLGDGVVAAVVDGWLYGAFRPLSDPGLVPVRIARAQQAAEDDEHLRTARDWLDVTGPGFERRRRAVSDLDGAVRLVRDVVRARFAMIGGVQEPVVEWVLHARDHLEWPADRALALVTDPGGRAPHLDGVVAAVCSVPALRARICDGDVPTASELRAEPAVAAALDELLDVEGDLPLLHDITAPTLAERPEHLPAAIAAAVVAAGEPSGAGPGAPADAAGGDAGPDRSARVRPAEGEEVLINSGAEDRAGSDERELDEAARRVLSRARIAHPARDASGDLLLRCIGTLRRIALAAGRDLGLPDPADALLFPADELAALLRGEKPDLGLLDERRDTHRRAAESPPPMTFGEPPGPPPDTSGLPEAAARTMRRLGTLVELRGGFGTGDGLTGHPAAAGTHIGLARVALEVEDAMDVRPGEVLVCPVTGPAWNLAMARAGALVCDSGGQLSHAAITAREFGIPAVVGCASATTAIRTGDRILVDGAAGVIRRL